MLMKKRLIVGVLFCVLFVIALACGYFIFNTSIYKIVLKNEKTPSKMHTNALTMMYEIEAGSGEYTVTSDNTWQQDGYVFNERLSGCENGSELSWDDERKVVILSTNVSDKCYVYFDVYVPTLADYIISQYTVDGENGIYLHDGQGTYGAQEAGDNSYRFSGANPNNYVCFGSDEGICPEDNLYRIIGVFGNEVKLIKYDGDSSSWSVPGTNEGIWNESVKPDIYTTLNETYYSSLSLEWQNLIAESVWQVGGMAWSETNTAKQYYNIEVGTGQSGYEETMKIGLMYVSDYGYAASPENWETSLGNYSNALANNWLFFGEYEWTISTTGSVLVYSIWPTGNVGSNLGRVGMLFRPTFYLNSNVILAEGTGTQTDPYRIA